MPTAPPRWFTPPASRAEGRAGGGSVTDIWVLEALGSEPADLGLDEVVDLAVHHRGRVPGLVSGPQVLDVLVRVQNVVPDLRPPAPGVVPAQLGHLRLLLLPLALEQLGLQHRHGAGAVLDLAALV